MFCVIRLQILTSNSLLGPDLTPAIPSSRQDAKHAQRLWQVVRVLLLGPVLRELD